MATDLFLSASGLDPRALLDSVPPACRTPTGVSAARATDGVVGTADEIEQLVEVPQWAARCGAVHLVPSFSALTATPLSFRFEISVRLSGAWSPWVATDTIGGAVFDPLPPTDMLRVDIDELTTVSAVEAIRLRLRWRTARAALASPWLIALSASDRRPPPSPPSSVMARGATLRVPAISQMTVGGRDAMRICSPTSVAMVLGYWGRDVPALSLAADVFHAATDRYGVWPAAIAAAARHDVAGSLLRFPDWAAAAWCLEHEMPVVASVRFAEGELRGAPLAQTSGHLVVLTGYDGDHVLVNDPAAAGEDTVPRRYLRSDLERVWLQRTAIGYVLFPPPRAIG